MLSTRDPLQIQVHIQMEIEGWEKVFYPNGNEKKKKKAGVAKPI